MEYVGLGDPTDEVVTHGDVAARKFVALRTAGRVSAAMAVNTWDVIEALKTTIGLKADDVDVTALRT